MTEKNPHKPYRAILSFAGGKYDLRIQTHDKNPDLLVLKSANPEAIDNLILATGVDPEITERFKGSQYHIIFASKAGVAKLLAAAVINLATKQEAAAALALSQMAEVDDDATPDADDDDGDDDGDGEDE